jgi:hypothetical protein
VIGRRESGAQKRVLVGKRDGKRPLEKPRVILKWVLKTQDGVEDGIILTQDRDKWRGPLNTVFNPRVP